MSSRRETGKAPARHRRAAPPPAGQAKQKAQPSPAGRRANGTRPKGGVGKAKAAAAARHGTTRRGSTKASAGNRSNGVAAPTRLMRIRELDPQAACGQGTTVLQLFRVDDLPFGNETTHLVFFDRHGWYCEHGRECPAVAAVRKHEKHVTSTR